MCLYSMKKRFCLPQIHVSKCTKEHVKRPDIVHVDERNCACIDACARCITKYVTDMIKPFYIWEKSDLPDFLA